MSMIAGMKDISPDHCPRMKGHQSIQLFLKKQKCLGMKIIVQDEKGIFSTVMLTVIIMYEGRNQQSVNADTKACNRIQVQKVFTLWPEMVIQMTLSINLPRFMLIKGGALCQADTYWGICKKHLLRKLSYLFPMKAFFVEVPIFLVSQMGQIFISIDSFWKIRAHFLMFINLCVLLAERSIVIIESENFHTEAMIFCS